DSLLNPSAVIEVLSDSTETYDRGKKFESYRNIISLQEYMLVSSERKKNELFSKSPEGKWVLSESGKERTIDISSLNLHISVSDVYEKIEFEN
ncbi:MAG TPA: Uma2 family endonuclease, partial [Leptospiraceae bacterium]|nr:Uma2 family endonuclease [Leptospiraceae bacterium]